MARQLRLEYEGAIYHVTVRSNGREDLFGDDKDRLYLISRLGESAERYGVRLYLFCLMTNHFHVVVETPSANLGRFMQSVLTGYTVYFNLRHSRHGHVTQGRYGARVVAGDDYLLKLSRYVHLNPVCTKGVKSRTVRERVEILRDYRWSSYPGYSGTGARFEMVEEGPMLALVGGQGDGRRTAYRRFVEDGLRNPDEEFRGEMWRSSRSIGNDSFREWVDACHEKGLKTHRRPEDVSFRKPKQKKCSAGKVEETVAKICRVARSELKDRRRGGFVKGLAAMMLMKHAHLTQREATVHLGLKTGAGVSYQVRRLTKQMATNLEVKNLADRIDKSLGQQRGN